MKNGYLYFQKFAGKFSPVFSAKFNPLYHLGDIAIFMFVVALVSGIYLFLFYTVDPVHSYQSVEALSRQWVGGIMRSIHRYSSDLLVIFIVLHFLQMLLAGKYGRQLSWVSGVVSFLTVILIGVTGFVLVWDEKAKMLGILTAKFLAASPLFDSSLTGAFLLNDLATVGGFFRVAVFGHIFLSLFTGILLWVHLARLSSPKLLPPKPVMLYTGVAMILVCLIFPVVSDPPAQNVILPTQTTFDWYYFFGYYFMKILSPGGNWLLLFGSGALLALLPYFLRKKTLPPPVIDLDKCDGCDQCIKDCPYAAIDLLPQFGEPYQGESKAILDPSKCVGCLICVASCKEFAILSPIVGTTASAVLAQKQDLVIFKCRFSEVERPSGLDVEVIEVPCIGDVHPEEVDLLLKNRANGVAFVSCEECYYRFGREWEEKRLGRNRRPVFARRSSLQRVRVFAGVQKIEMALRQFADHLKSVDDKKSENKLSIVGQYRPRHLAAGLITLAFFVLMPFFSNPIVRFYNPENRIVIVNFHYISSATEYEQASTNSATHMKPTQPMVKHRSPVMLNLYDKDHQLFYSKEFKPRGLRQDIAIFVFDEIKTGKSQVDVELVETAFPDKKLTLDNVPVSSTDGTVIILREGKLEKM
ncbi:MAG: 4Fe-4S binding protein [Saprospiraceae bacterium]|nr:4Fe-4S binding protein [Saprospiraceae bacterium]